MILAQPLMATIELIGFPLYRWHWPLLPFPRITEIDPPSPGLRAATLALNVLLARLTYRFIDHTLPASAYAAHNFITPILNRQPVDWPQPVHHR
ncbi:MAG: hypothetical protein WBN83_09280 [Desulfoprunum sp.]|jgi:peptidoglycan/LPS O-acetylase OafA/YrhL|uniref:hypothetical protein n=1 Tax=Desulfoprunum sp. TaxID=2020866 RepID=UPI00052C18E4|nr:hypothetical protein JT06_16455 [Desulfobulbus sp. Tol-SR]